MWIKNKWYNFYGFWMVWDDMMITDNGYGNW